MRKRGIRVFGRRRGLGSGRSDRNVRARLNSLSRMGRILEEEAGRRNKWVDAYDQHFGFGAFRGIERT
jgi:hypothetical protein